MKFRAGPALAAGLALAALTSCSSPPPLVPTSATDAEAIRDAVTERGVLAHVQALQSVADAEGGTRASGTSGYEESARYVEEQLREAGYEPVRQRFSYWNDWNDEEVQSFNIVADSPGSDAQTVVVGGHLDSVAEGAGINDNATGVAAILETAEWLAESGIEPSNRVRFAFWGGEEDGFYGSNHYVSELTGEQVDSTAVYLNLDMVGSPNGVRFVHDGDGSDSDRGGPKGSDVIEEVFLDYFAQNDLAAEPTSLDGGSDYEAFQDAGIAVGGLFTGDSGIKSDAEVRLHGGTAGREYDPCYHQGCDTLDNVDPTMLREMTAALVFAARAFAVAPPPE
ncbi:M20/M25/M40 family metallo-hydrolase [Arthrobacter crusticola]|uniref:M20/M25/M40 family metallo-hydrolase n=1 Tax=Arthrobacter crusticola TaxID=2547960 RepID=A0A4R5U021_9MICC|nr:M20/M25/M40 family metallo-hydrolase [Arthrobacter crusticola]TDK26875.1 M20/M25/M40 family metallo-hydrolase [Arthrobacter crusticola]